MDAIAPIPSPQLLEEYSKFFRLLSEPARLQLLCLLRQGGLDVGSLIEATAPIRKEVRSGCRAQHLMNTTPSRRSWASAS